jgi:hypothetical protein
MANLPCAFFSMLMKPKKTVVNLKAYKNMDFGSVWAGLSLQKSLDGASFRILMEPNQNYNITYNRC